MTPLNFNVYFSAASLQLRALSRRSSAAACPVHSQIGQLAGSLQMCNFRDLVLAAWALIGALVVTG